MTLSYVAKYSMTRRSIALRQPSFFFAFFVVNHTFLHETQYLVPPYAFGVSVYRSRSRVCTAILAILLEHTHRQRSDYCGCQGYVPLTLDVMRVAFKVPLAFHTPL